MDFSIYSHIYIYILVHILIYPYANHGAGIFTVRTQLGHKHGVNGWIHIPAPWSIWDIGNFIIPTDKVHHFSEG